MTSTRTKFARVPPADRRRNSHEIMRVSEQAIHLAVVSHLRLRAAKGCFLHIPNQGMRSLAAAAQLRALGMVPGAADLLLISPQGVAHWLELKREGGRPSAEQTAFLAAAAAGGCPCAVAYGIDEALEPLRLLGVLPASL
jgi:hypothetical protein